MNRSSLTIPSPRRRGRLQSALLLSMAFVGGSALAENQDIVFPCTNVDTTYAAKPSETITPTDIETNNGGDVFWVLSNTSGNTACTGGPLIFQCAGLTVTVPDPEVAVSPTTPAGKVTITGTASSQLAAQGKFSLTVTDAATPATTCSGTYLMHTTSNGGGWGDPHLTTVDGINYDFQSAGEFTALREDELEIQARQTAVPSATIPITNEYTGLRSCVALYTAVAARVGSSRVTLQPNLTGEPDPKSMQLRVNGELVTLTDKGIELVSGEGDPGVAGSMRRVDGRIVKSADGVIQIIDSRGTQLVVTPQFWDSQKLWYLNINVYQTSALSGTMGKLAEGSWLPALPDGTSLGAKPDSTSERYQQLYEKFADAWRVTDSTSLFDYAPGTNTATFTLDEWPRDNPQSCGIEGQTPVQPATDEVAQQACAAITDAGQKANCVFDVTVTGNTGFGKGYEIMQAVEPTGSGWQSPGSTTTEPPVEPKPFRWWWILLILLLIIIIVLIARRK